VAQLVGTNLEFPRDLAERPLALERQPHGLLPELRTEGTSLVHGPPRSLQGEDVVSMKAGQLQVVTDVVMPVMDGWELGRRLAIDLPAVPVLYMSAYPREGIFQRGGWSPSVPFLQKPFAPDVFLTTVRELLERAGTCLQGSPAPRPPDSYSGRDPSAPRSAPDPVTLPSELSRPDEPVTGWPGPLG
jgi:CheY-like chemotaxis protein